MSKGPGKWQRAILERLDQVDYFYLMELLPIDYYRTDYKALHRAAYQLAKTGKINIQRFMSEHAKVCITKTSFTENTRKYEQAHVKPGESIKRPSIHHPISTAITLSENPWILSIEPRSDLVEPKPAPALPEETVEDDESIIDGTWTDPEE
jgi:hypothetical protein